jgi:serine phosphatase RsbU (regulator of sigma subunit)
LRDGDRSEGMTGFGPPAPTAAAGAGQGARAGRETRNPILSNLELWDVSAELDATVAQIERLFLENPRLPGIVLTEDAGVAGVLSRKRLTAALSRPYARDLFVRSPLRRLITVSAIDTVPLSLHERTEVAQAASMVLARPAELVYEPIIVTGGARPRILEIDLLIRTQSQMLHEAGESKDRLIADVRRGADELRATLIDLEQTRDRLLQSEARLEGEVARRTLELERINADLLQRQQQIDEELEVARSLQQSILPAAFPHDARLEGRSFMRAARMIGGDFYDVFKLDDHRIGIVVADVSGKGVPAALFMILVRTMLQDLATHHESPGQCVSRANSILLERNPLSLFVTLIYGIVDTRTGVFTFCNGGHPMPYLVRAGGAVELITQRPSPIVGLLETAAYRDIQVQMAPGDTLYLVTDGVTECFSPSGDAFGEKRLVEFLRSEGTEPLAKALEELIARLDNFSQGIAPSDDVTAVIARFHGEAQPGLPKPDAH